MGQFAGSSSAVFALLAMGVFGAPAPAADAWPSRPVKMIVSFAPGGTTDILGRIVAEKLTESLGQPFIVENRAGAGGIVGAQAVAKAPPDGYTLLATGIGPLVVVPAMNPNAPYDPIRDFTHIALFGGPPAVLAVPRDLPLKDLNAFVAFAKTRPGALKYGSPGVGSHGQLIFEMLKQEAGLSVIHVPYRGSGQVVTDLMGGHIPAASTTLTGVAEQIKASTIRGLAVSSAHRLPDFPDIPTYAEQGYPKLVSNIWFCLVGPARLPENIVKRLNAEVIRAFQQPDVRERLGRDAIDPEPLDAAAFTAFVKSEIKRWTPIIKAANMESE
jgi:tripartite-type tricarboxylate transporter receptor subunit TctC